MNVNRRDLPVIPVAGLPPTSLGAYLAALGLFRVCSRFRHELDRPPIWRDVRAAWRDDVFYLVGGPRHRDELVDALMTIADEASWTPYRRGWAAEQKSSTKAKSGRNLALWQASADEVELELFGAHAVPASRVFFNPLLGSGGNAGKRAFADGWKKATEALRSPKMAREALKNKATADGRRDALLAFLEGEASCWQAVKLNAASWFSNANKLYNSGQHSGKRAHSVGVISPWAMALACEGLVFFVGSASRRLGARTKSVGAFPFVVAATAPETSGETGRDKGEVWAPLWSRPMTVPELAALFARGRAEIFGRGAVTSAAFAVAVAQRGTDAGITEFRRFALGKTTSSNTFESRYLGATPLLTSSTNARSQSFERILYFIDSLPPDRKEGKGWRFFGLRGPVEAALVAAVDKPNDPEAITVLLDAVVQTLDRVDANLSFRAATVSWRPLHLAWLAALFDSEEPDIEARLALSLASSFPVEYPFSLYRFGVEWGNRSGHPPRSENSMHIHPAAPPTRWIWRTGPLARSLAMLVQRRLLDWGDDKRLAGSPLRTPITVQLSHVKAWLNGNVDEALLGRWLSRMALFDWASISSRVRALASTNTEEVAVDPAIALYGLFHPLFDLRPVSENGHKKGRDLLPHDSGARTPIAARRIGSLIRAGDVDRAVDVAYSRFAMARVPLMRVGTAFAMADPERLFAALLFPVSNRDRSMLVQRWLRPHPTKQR